MVRVLVTGGAGYIGGHTALLLADLGHEVTIVDNLTNSHIEAVDRIRTLTTSRIQFLEMDIRDRGSVLDALNSCKAEAVIHFAGLKSVGESSRIPLTYYDNNFAGTMNVIAAMSALQIKTLIFSSSATVYGANGSSSISETHPLQAINPYGRTKLFTEQLLRDVAGSDPEWQIGILRYFNPAGAHSSGLIGEDPLGTPNNLIPFVAQVAAGRLDCVSVFGQDYATPDGTGVRDYIHVGDLAAGHISALEYIGRRPGAHTWNLGTGKGHSVLDVITTFSAVSGRDIEYKFVPRRLGDAAISVADPSLAEKQLGWKAQRGLHAMLEDQWRWQCQNPYGYRTVKVLDQENRL